MVQVFEAPAAAGGWGMFWDALAALGTVGAVAVALCLSGRERRQRRADEDARARLATIVLWPDLRRYLAALRALERHEGLRFRKMASDRRVSFNKILGQLTGDSALVARMAADLHSEEADRMARIIANVRHANRHATQLFMEDGALDQQGFDAKVSAIRKSAREARRDLLPLIRKARNLMEGRL